MGNIGAQELLIVALIFILIFGARKLPETAKGIAQSLRVFKKELRDEDKPVADSTHAIGRDEESESTPSTSATTATSFDIVAANANESVTPAARS